MCFYFEEPFAKKYYDSILTNYKNKEKLFFIYPYFYHAIGNGCIYIKSGKTKQMVNYVRHYYPMEIDDLIVTFNFDTDSVTGYKEKIFKSIPEKIEDYHLFRSRIQISSKSIEALNE